MKLLHLAALTLLTLAIPVHAQTSDSQLSKQFSENFKRGCNQGKAPGVKNQSGYCRCLADSYQERYSGQELAAIGSSIAVLGEKGPAIINLMMAPETRMCSAKN